MGWKDRLPTRISHRAGRRTGAEQGEAQPGHKYSPWVSGVAMYFASSLRQMDVRAGWICTSGGHQARQCYLPSLAACFRGERLEVGQSEQDRKIPVTQLVNLANPGLGLTREAYAQGD